MELKPMEAYETPRYSSFRLKSGKLLPAGIAIVSSLALLSGCGMSATTGVPPIYEVEPSGVVATENLPTSELDKAAPVQSPELELLMGDIALAEFSEE